MKENKEQIARIKKMERNLVRAKTAMRQLSTALDKYLNVQEAIEALNTYYSSDVWKQDFADDEAGLLPADLKRGVLSEDGIWDLLTDYKELNSRLEKAVDMINATKL